MVEYLELLKNTLQNQIVQAIICVFSSIVAAKLADWIISRTLSRLVDRTSSTIDDKIIQILHRPIYYSILFIGLGISVKAFSLPEVLSFVLLGLFKTIAVIIWSFALFQSFMHFIIWYGRQSKKDNIFQKHTLPLFDNVGKVIIFILGAFLILLSWGINVTG